MGLPDSYKLAQASMDLKQNLLVMHTLAYARSCSDGGSGSGLRAGGELGSGGVVSSEHGSEVVNILKACADVWVGLVEKSLKESLLSDEVESPPGRGNEVPDGHSTGDDSASSSVESKDHVLGKGTGHHLEGNVDGTSGDGDSLSNELLETGIGVGDGLSLAFWDDG